MWPLIVVQNLKLSLKLTHRLGRCNFAVLNNAVVKIKGVDVCRSMGHYMMHVQILMYILFGTQYQGYSHSACEVLMI